jgi:hypothetical protein
MAMSLHLHHIPQADILKYRLEILQIIPHPNKPAHLNMQPHERGQYNIILAIDTYLVAVVKETMLHDIWLVDLTG